MPPVTPYSPNLLALLHSPETVRLQRVDVFSRPLDGLDEGTHYSLKQALPFLPAGPVRNAALLFSEKPNVSFSYKLAANGGPAQVSFIEEPLAGVPYKNGTFLSTGGPGNNLSSNNAFETNVGGVVLVVGASKLLEKGGMPQPVIAPFIGGTFALADTAGTYFLNINPEAPMLSSVRGNLASLGVGTAVNVGFSYGLDLIGAKQGTDANTWGSILGTVGTFAPAIESSMNPVYWPEYAAAFRSSIGVGLSGGAEGSSIFLAEGGVAGGAGVGGAVFQGLGVVGAVWTGGALGGWLTKHVTAMDDANDPQGQLAKLTMELFQSEAYGFLGNTPAGDIMAGILSLNEIGDDIFGITDPNEAQLSKGLKLAEEQIVLETKVWAGAQMDSVLIQSIMANSNVKEHPGSTEPQIDAMDFDGLQKTLRQVYMANSDAIYAHDKVMRVLGQNGLISADDMGVTRFIDNNGFITNKEGLKNYAADLLEKHLQLRNEELDRRVKEAGLVVGSDGNFQSKYGGAFTQDQLDFMSTTMPTLGGAILRLTNALATLRPEAVGYEPKTN
jgi:hypothetical protein